MRGLRQADCQPSHWCWCHNSPALESNNGSSTVWIYAVYSIYSVAVQGNSGSRWTGVAKRWGVAGERTEWDGWVKAWRDVSAAWPVHPELRVVGQYGLTSWPIMNVQTLISLSSVDPIWSGSPLYFITSSLQQIQIETPLLLLPRPQSLQRGWVYLGHLVRVRLSIAVWSTLKQPLSGLKGFLTEIGLLD